MKNISGLLNTMVDDVIFTQNTLNYPFSHIDRSDNKISQIKRVLPSDFRAVSLLDVGCNAAVVTSGVAEHVGARIVHGIDPSDLAVIAARKNLAKFEQSSVFQVDFGQFETRYVYDLLMFIDVLEHLEDPVGTLRRASEITSYSIVRVPLEGSIINRFSRGFLGRNFYKIMERRYGHIQHFNPDSIRQTIYDGGFDVIRNCSFRISPEAQILETPSYKYTENIIWYLTNRRYPSAWGGSYLAFCKSKGVRVIDNDTYKRIHSALVEEFGEGNLVSVVLFGSCTGNTSKRYSDYDFTILLKELPEDVHEREIASPRLKRRLRNLNVSNLCAFNLYTQSEYSKADAQRSWLIESMKRGYRILYDTNGFVERSLSSQKPNIERTGTYSWKGIDVENSNNFIQIANRHLSCAKILEKIDPELSSYHRTEWRRGLFIAKLYDHGVYQTRGSSLTLAKELVYKFGEDIDLAEIQREDFEQEVDCKRLIYDYNSIDRNLHIASILANKGFSLEALFHTYSALKNIYLKVMHENDIYIFDGEISQLFLREFVDYLPPQLIDLLYQNSFNAEQILGRSGYASFDLNSEGKPIYAGGKSSEYDYLGLIQNLRRAIEEMRSRIPTLLPSNDVQTNTDPKISVVVATYNRQHHLLTCLNSLNKLIIPRNKVEIIVVDDGSIVSYDPERLKMQTDFPVRYIKKEHSGICATKNRGIEESKGEYVAFLDDDMVVSPFWIVNLMSGFRNERIAGVGSTNLTYPDNNPLAQYSDYRELLRAPIKDKTGQILNVLTCSAVIRKDVLIKVSGFNKKQSELGINFGGDDVDLTWKIRNFGFQFNYVEEAVCFHNHRSNYADLIRQHIGYGEGTMFHCIDKGRDPAELDIPRPNYKDVAADICHYISHEIPRRIIECYRNHLGLKRSIQYPLLDLSRRFFYNVGILKARKYIIKTI